MAQRIIAVIGGTGDQGFGLALRWAKSGERILIGSRQQQKAEDAARRALKLLDGHGAIEGHENPKAASMADIVVLTVPFAAQVDILKSIVGDLNQDDIFVDVTVPLATAFGGRATRTVGVWQGSAAEQAAELVPKGVEVVSAFHNVVAEALQDLTKPVDCDVIICGGSKKAKETVMELAKKIPGVRPVDGGPLETARIVEQITALLVGFNIRYKVTGTGIRITGLPNQ